MKKIIQIYSIPVLCLAILLSCSTKKDAFVNRTFHNVTTKYNVLFNGKNALNDGREALINSYIDNYWEVLPIERMQVKDEAALPGQGTPKNPNFTKAEEKAVKAIQKHSMVIKGRQRNSQIDEAYLLLGEARYYDQRFVPALEAFNYIIRRYAESDKVNEARIWREKTNLRLENEELAIENLEELLKREKLKDQEQADANAVLGQAYINLRQKREAVKALKRAAAYTKINPEKGRYNYIIGQLYNELGHKDSANIAFDKVIELNRKSPRIYMINAYMEKAKNFDLENEDQSILLEMLTDLEEDRENRPFLDKIYRQIGDYHYANDSILLAEEYYNKSLKERSLDRYLKAKNYKSLATIRFDDAKYKDAGAYYDSTLINLEKNTKEFRRVEKKRNNLDDVIAYEDVVKVDDSILRLVALPKEDREAFFQKYIDKLKAEEEARKALEEEKAEQNFVKNEFYKPQNNTPNFPGQGTSFYFYTPTTVAYGKNEFRKVWGDLRLEDNWRRSNKSTISKEAIATTNAAGGENAEGSQDIYSTAFYTDKIPSDDKVIDSIIKERDFANYQLGLIYKEKFKEYELAADRLEKVLENNPEEKLVLPSKYNLYKIYTILESSKADTYKNDIIKNHGESRYAQILLNPEQQLTADQNSPEILYAKTYKDFQSQNFEKVITDCETYISQFNGDEIVPKFEMLKATALARLDGLPSYKESLNYIALNYPNNAEGKKAQNILDTSLIKLEKKQIVPDDKATNFKIVYTFNKNSAEDATALQERIDKAIKDFKYETILSVSKDVYDRNQLFVVVHGFESRSTALGFEGTLRRNEEYNVTNESTILSSVNYRTIQMHKNFTEYN